MATTPPPGRREEHLHETRYGPDLEELEDRVSTNRTLGIAGTVLGLLAAGAAAVALVLSAGEDEGAQGGGASQETVSELRRDVQRLQDDVQQVQQDTEQAGEAAEQAGEAGQAAEELQRQQQQLQSRVDELEQQLEEATQQLADQQGQDAGTQTAPSP